ncbi:MAG TPA: prepilin peptidase [Hungateiclostridium thermocellum]|uniref:Prepilin leader peptidase/N-methyltransferase n=1 Tax=Acetivibrio thermocellus (strain ATCC 27405 / DSM 1237 / JCM 9322 / NBRC 103400 / NCIMB 10682 / NRRL B-4536 / VPI 7372) TaxID=203119 RepID=A3DDQ7_ACET2|nr:A24 family peptidase [Acetivibrio thermocellus]CDG35544.1 type 4 prepilin peptidase 1 [Acetivibrio thermocellus BC1]ABN52086.1 Prepilin peptidase [Acetivibrio thermocellus ATCC 27405]NLU27703.1 prepilin peptidase [Acetivibrio thermocellus]THJ77270.1 prepilin peptidase [Acetivibrio thermocellus]UWV48315.1 prepilin peptidase [Acetivibrio thermocellus]
MGTSLNLGLLFETGFTVFCYISVALLGLLVGSFLNVCIYRIPNDESVVRPRSHCMKCGHTLGALDLVPVFSYLFLKGRCRYCGEKISPRYALVELLTSVVYLLLFWKYGLSVDFLASAYLMSVLIAVFFIDLDHMIIPNKLVVAALVGGVLPFVYNIFRPMDIYVDRKWWNPLLGAFIGFGFLLLVAIVGYLVYKTDEAMGGGDVKLFAPIGLFLGWKMTIVALFISFVSAGIVSIVLLLLKKKERRSTFVFGPFIVMGTFFTYLFGWELLEWYLSTLLHV